MCCNFKLCYYLNKNFYDYKLYLYTFRTYHKRKLKKNLHCDTGFYTIGLFGDYDNIGSRYNLEFNLKLFLNIYKLNFIFE